MRTRIVLFLVSTVVVFGCVQQREEYRLTHVAFKDAHESAPVAADPCTDENPCVTVHEVVLDGTCPDTLRLGSRDVVKFLNRTGRPVNVFGLDNEGRLASRARGPSTNVRLSGIYVLPLTGHDSLGYVQVNKNPYSDPPDSLIFQYSVRYTGSDGLLCGEGPKVRRFLKISTGPTPFFSVPPTMIVGADTL